MPAGAQVSIGYIMTRFESIFFPKQTGKCPNQPKYSEFLFE